MRLGELVLGIGVLGGGSTSLYYINDYMQGGYDDPVRLGICLPVALATALGGGYLLRRGMSERPRREERRNTN